jgi:hypothetical protein
VAKKKPLTPARAAELRKMMAAIEKELGMEPAEESAPQTSLHALQKQLREHRAAMRQVPGGIISLDDERREALLIRAIEIARAPEAATRGHSDGLERDGDITNAGLSGTNEADLEGTPDAEG